MSTSTSDLDSEDDDDTKRRRKKGEGGSGRETEEDMRKRILYELEEERRALERELKELKEKTEEQKVTGGYYCVSYDALLTGTDLSAEQRQAIFAAPEFSAFVKESTKIVQRALSDGYDYIKDYTIGIEGALWVNPVDLSSGLIGRSDEADGQKVKLLCAFSNDRWTNGRSVTDLDWSQKVR